MKQMKFWKSILMMFVVFILASCSQDDDAFDTNNLSGTWEQVYEKGVVSEGYIQYTFTPETPSFGFCSIHTYDVFAGDTTYQRAYKVTNEGRRLIIFELLYGGIPETQEWDILKLSTNKMAWCLVGNLDIIQNFKKVIGNLQSSPTPRFQGVMGSSPMKSKFFQ